MLGVLIILLISVGIAHRVKGEAFAFLGLNRPELRLREFAWGLAAAALIAGVVHSLSVFLQGGSWSVARGASAGVVLTSLGWDLRSVVTEELVFRGALLWLVIKRFGESRAVALSAAAFGLYHLFSMGVLGSLIPMLFVFFGTGLAGYAWALAYARSGSVVLPIAMHFGWNLVQNSLLSMGPLGATLFVATTEGESSTLVGLSCAIIVMLLPALVMIWLVRRREYGLPVEATADAG